MLRNRPRRNDQNMTELLSQVVLYSEPMVPAGATSREIQVASLRHRDMAGELARELGGEPLCHLGRGAITLFPEWESALAAARALEPARAALDVGVVRDRDTAAAEPPVLAVRRLMRYAGPGETLISPRFRHSVGLGAVWTVPLQPDDADPEAEPLGYRLLGEMPRRKPNPLGSAWYAGVALLAATIAAVSALALAMW